MRRYAFALLLTSCGTHLAKPSDPGSPNVAPVPNVKTASPPPQSKDAAGASSETLIAETEQGSPLDKQNLVSQEADLGAFNEWATKNRLRDNIAHWIAVGLPMHSDIETSLEVKYKSGEAPTEAVATVIQDRYLDDSIRGEKFIFTLVKKPCESCRNKQSGWWVQSLDVTQRCWEGRGHQEFSKLPCN